MRRHSRPRSSFEDSLIGYARRPETAVVGSRERRGDRILSVFSVVRVHGRDDLRQIILRLRFLRLVLHAAEGGEQESHQDYDNGNDDEKLD